MTRPIAVLLLAALVFGTLTGYSRFVASLPSLRSEHHEPPPADGSFRLELTLSFDAATDAFSLPDDPSLLIRLGGHDLLRRTNPVSATETIAVTNPPGIVAGRNAFYVRAIPDKEAIARPCAVQLRILRDDQLLRETTLWSQPGDVVSGEVHIDLSETVPPQASSEGGHS